MMRISSFMDWKTPAWLCLIEGNVAVLTFMPPSTHPPTADDVVAALTDSAAHYHYDKARHHTDCPACFRRGAIEDHQLFCLVGRQAYEQLIRVALTELRGTR